MLPCIMWSLKCMTSSFNGIRLNNMLRQPKQLSHFTESDSCNLCKAMRNLMYRCFGTTSKRRFSVAIEGNIASGKTSLLQYFRDSKYATIYAEPVSKWRNVQGHNALGHMYEDPKRWALTFQTYVQLTMLETHLAKPDSPVKLMERSIFSAKYCFVENLRNRKYMPEIEYVVLSSWFDWIVRNNDCSLDLIVYLRTDPETVHKRIQNRGRREEKPVSLEYLTSLHDLHEEWLIRQTKFDVACKVLVLDANQDVEGMINQFEQHKSEILCGFDEPACVPELHIPHQYELDDSRYKTKIA